MTQQYETLGRRLVNLKMHVSVIDAYDQDKGRPLQTLVAAIDKSFLKASKASRLADFTLHLSLIAKLVDELTRSVYHATEELKCACCGEFMGRGCDTEFCQYIQLE
jgi:hypothetical protein